MTQGSGLLLALVIQAKYRIIHNLGFGARGQFILMPSGSVIKGRIFKIFIHVTVRKTEVLLSARYKKRGQRLKIQTGCVHGNGSEDAMKKSCEHGPWHKRGPRFLQAQDGNYW